VPEYTFESSQPVKLRVRLPRGHIRVAAANSENIAVSVEPLNTEDTRAEEAADRTQVALNGRDLVVESPDRGSLLRWAPPKLAVTITVPTGSHASVKTASAGLETTGWLGSLRLSTASGDMSGESFAGDVTVRTASGEVAIGTVGGSLSVQNASGSIRVGSIARNARMNTASGHLEIGEAAGSVRGHSASGDVSVGRAHSGRIDVNTASGSIDVGVVEGVGVWMDVRSFSGEVSSDLEVGDAAPATGCALEIRAQSMSGDVRVRRAPGPVTPQDETSGPASPKVLA
jgi:hypothetical protein